MKRTGQKSQVISQGDKSVLFGEFAIARPSMDNLRLQIPMDSRDIQVVVVNGESFYKEGAIVETIRTAPMIFSENHFYEVDVLVEKHYHTASACREVADKYNFNPESFRQQYYKRHASKKHKVTR
jgi:hypothetical protein